MVEQGSGDGIRASGRADAPDARARSALYDVLIVGGGPAGLSAALVLGRCRRRVLVIDSGRPRNAAATAMHGYLGRDGLDPREFLRLGREEVARYGVELLADEVDSARVFKPGPDDHSGPDPRAAFEVSTRGGRTALGRRMLLATGIRDILPPIEGVERYYGRGVHHCPYCDGWEHRDGALIAYGEGRAAVGLALSLRTWSDRVTACPGPVEIGAKDRGRLRRNGIALRAGRVVRLEGSDGALRRVVFESGPPLDCDALFFSTDQVQHSPLYRMLGCEVNEVGHVPTRGKQRTCVAGLYLAGDAGGDVQFVIVAAAEGTRAATAINRELQDEDRGEAPRPRTRPHDGAASGRPRRPENAAPRRDSRDASR